MLKTVFKVAAPLAMGCCLITAAHAETFKLNSKVDFAEGAHIREAVKKECNLQTKLPDFVKEFSGRYDVDVVLEDKPKTKKGSYLSLKITEVHASGGGAWSGPKSVSVAGKLFKNGKQVSKFTATRYSSGGFFGGFKGTCSIAGRCIKTLGSDIAKWLSNPKDGAHLGDG